MKRHEIVQMLELYESRGNLEALIGALHFEPAEELRGWKVYDREEMFAASSGKMPFLVAGRNPRIDTVRKDLKAIGKVLGAGWLSRKIRDGSMVPAFIATAGLAAFRAADYYAGTGLWDAAADYLQVPIAKELRPEIVAAGALGTVLAGSLATLASGPLLERYYGARLSGSAERYLYGHEAEQRLLTELLYEKTRAGAVPKEIFLRKHGFEF